MISHIKQIITSNFFNITEANFTCYRLIIIAIASLIIFLNIRVLLSILVPDIVRPIIQNQFFIKYGLYGLFVNGLLSSIIPIPTELTASALLLAGIDKMKIFLVLDISSIVGGLLAYFIGYENNIPFLKNRFYYRVKTTRKDLDVIRIFGMIERYGWVIIFFSPWIPVMGDIVSIVAGMKRYSFKKFVMAMMIGKTIKVAVIVVVLSGWILPQIIKW